MILAEAVVAEAPVVAPENPTVVLEKAQRVFDASILSRVAAPRGVELECVIWCPVDKVDKYSVYRVEGGGHGVGKHVTDPPDLTNYQAKYCEVCGAVLERKNG